MAGKSSKLDSIEQVLNNMDDEDSSNSEEVKLASKFSSNDYMAEIEKDLNDMEESDDSTESSEEEMVSKKKNQKPKASKKTPKSKVMIASTSTKNKTLNNAIATKKHKDTAITPSIPKSTEIETVSNLVDFYTASTDESKTPASGKKGKNFIQPRLENVQIRYNFETAKNKVFCPEFVTQSKPLITNVVIDQKTKTVSNLVFNCICGYPFIVKGGAYVCGSPNPNKKCKIGGMPRAFKRLVELEMFNFDVAQQMYMPLPICTTCKAVSLLCWTRSPDMLMLKCRCSGANMIRLYLIQGKNDVVLKKYCEQPGKDKKPFWKLKHFPKTPDENSVVDQQSSQDHDVTSNIKSNAKNL